MQTSAQNELQAALEVVRTAFQQGMSSLEAVNIGSAHVSKDEIIHSVSTSAQELRDFVVYGLSLIEFVNQGGTVEAFINGQLDFIASFDAPGHDPRSKAHWIKLLYRLYPEVADKLDELTT